MRLIDADVAIKEIKARNPDDVSYEDAWAITCIEHAPTIEPERTGKWIPVSERLPEVGDYVICSQINRDVGEGYLLPDGSWHILYESREYEADWVTAWMPLPEPYTEDKR